MKIRRAAASATLLVLLGQTAAKFTDLSRFSLNFLCVICESQCHRATPRRTAPLPLLVSQSCMGDEVVGKRPGGVGCQAAWQKDGTAVTEYGKNVLLGAGGGAPSKHKTWQQHTRPQLLNYQKAHDIIILFCTCGSSAPRQ